MQNSGDEDQWIFKHIALSAGDYTFFNAADFKYLSFSDRQLIKGNSITKWKLRTADNGLYVYTCTNDLLLDIDNAYVASGTTVKLWENTGYNTQIWKIQANANGTYSFLSSVNEKYCLGFDNGKAVLQLRNDGNKSQEWHATATVDTTPKNYLEYISNDENTIYATYRCDLTGSNTITQTIEVMEG